MTNKQLLEQIDADILKAGQEIQNLRVRLATLKEFRGKIAGVGHRKGRDADSDSGNRLPGAGVALRKLISENPGIDSEAVIESLRGNIKTKAANQERLIRNTIANMIREGLMNKNEDGGLYLA